MSGRVVNSKKSPSSSSASSKTKDIDAEEEEIALDAAFVSQIAHRKNKTLKGVVKVDSQESPNGSKGKKSKQANNNAQNKNLKTSKSTRNEPTNNNNSNKGKSGEAKVKSKNETKSTNNTVKSQDIKKSQEFGIIANDRVLKNDFSEAINYLTAAIDLNPSDYRFYLNRSYCYDQIRDYRSALRDSEAAIKLRPNWAKCYYRQGCAYLGLKNYQEAEISLLKVLELENDCKEAKDELLKVRFGAIVNMGYDEHIAKIYAAKFDTVHEAIEALIERDKQILKNKKAGFILDPVKTKPDFGPIGSKVTTSDASRRSSSNKSSENGFNDKSIDDDEIYVSDDEDICIYQIYSHSESNSNSNGDDDGPTNPFGWKALWVGNISLNCKLAKLTDMFRKYGTLEYCNVFRGTSNGTFALVHYNNSESPRKAMAAYQGKIVADVSMNHAPLKIRFRPNKDQKKPNYTEKLDSDECYYWRTTGCGRGSDCHYKHIPTNKGVDRQAWMIPTKKQSLT